MADQGYALNWDSSIEKDGGDFILLDEGEYTFIVESVEKGFFNGSAKIPSCPQAELSLMIATEKGKTSIKSKLLLWSTLEWKLAQFARSVGIKKHGEACRINYDKLVGLKGKCYVIQDTYVDKNGETKTTNRIDRFLDPVPNSVSMVQPAPAQTPAQTTNNDDLLG